MAHLPANLPPAVVVMENHRQGLRQFLPRARPSDFVLVLSAFGTLLWTPALSADEPGLDDYFEEAFGIPAEAQETPVELRVDDRPRGTVRALVTPAGTLEALAADELIEALEGLLNQEGRATVADAVDAGDAADANAEGFAAADALSEAELKPDYDRSSLSVELRIPGRYRKTQFLSVRRSGQRREVPEHLPSEGPAPLSGGTPVQGAVAYSEGEEQNGRVRGQLSLSPFISLHEWTLRATGGLSHQEGELRAEVSSAQLERLWPDPGIRLTAGRIAPTTGALQSGATIEGIALSRRVERDPRIRDPLAEFSLDEQSRIQLVVNQRVMYERSLGPGSYAIGDVPVTRGVNEVELRFPDTDKEPVRLSLPYATVVLPEGEREFSYAAGIAPVLFDSDRSLEDLGAELGRLSLFHREGFSRSVTGNVGIQGSPRVAHLSAGADVALPIGNVGLGTAISGSPEAGAGAGALISYGLFLPALPRRPSLRFGSEWTSAGLATLDEPAGRDGASLRLSAAYGQRLPGRLSANLRGETRHEWRNGSLETTSYTASLGLTSSRREGTRISAGLRYQGSTDDSPGLSGLSGSVTLRLSPSAGPTLSVRQEIAEPRTTTELTQSGNAGPLGHYQASLQSVQRFDTDQLVDQASGRATLSGRRGALTGRSSLSLQSGSVGAYRLRASMESGMLFAGSSVALARVPEDGSFVVVSIPREEELEEVEVSAGGRSTTVTPGFLGAHALGVSEPYETVMVELDPGAIPLGHELADRRIAARTSLRSGTAVQPSLEGTVYVRGRILDEQEEPVSLRAGQVYDSDEERPPQLVFTNADGRFEARGLQAGTYVIDLGEPAGSIEFSVPEDQTGLYHLGDLHFASDGDQEDGS